MRTLLVTEENFDVLRRMFPEEPSGKGGMRPGWEIDASWIDGETIVRSVIYQATQISLAQRVG